MHETPDRFPCWFVQKDESAETVSGGVHWMTPAELPPIDSSAVTIAVEYSSLNYKDALACQGHRGVVAKLPHVPGIDCAGTVISSDTAEHRAGDPVLVTGYDLGGARWGGYSAVVRVPAEWVVPLGDRLTRRQAMTYGTAGFTAAQCVMAVVDRVKPGAGEVVVTGATGGVGVFSVAILSKLGYHVTAVTGKPEETETLRQLGAAEVVGREELDDDSGRPMLTERWAAAIDTVGGAPLAHLVRSLRHRGVVAACGLVAGTDLPLTVYPFILRGVTLAGIDSAKCPAEPRREVWQRLAGDWRVELPDSLVTTVDFGGLPAAIERILAGGMVGRTLVQPSVSK